MEMDGGSDPTVEKKRPVFRDIRRYYCEYCGICRSKKSLIASHLLSHHNEELQDATSEVDTEGNLPVRYGCNECSASFRKPAYLRQHMQSHSSERPFTCPVDDCEASYRRKDHLTRHMLGHQGKLFTCPVDNCNRQFSYQATMRRHVVEIHDEESSSEDDHPKLYICPEAGCGKAFKYPSKLKKHEQSHVKSDHVEIPCNEPGCMKYFTNKECLKAHIRCCHLYAVCSLCGAQQLKKNMKRHLRTHEEAVEVGRIRCSFDGCQHFFTNRSNLKAHVRAVHLEERPFACRISGCDKRFPFKHVRDKHENSGVHAYAPGDFLESDQLVTSRPRGGRKRNHVSVESLFRKRVAPPDQNCILDDPSDYLSWLLGEERE